MMGKWKERTGLPEISQSGKTPEEAMVEQRYSEFLRKDFQTMRRSRTQDLRLECIWQFQGREWDHSASRRESEVSVGQGLDHAAQEKRGTTDCFELLLIQLQARGQREQGALHSLK